MSNFKIPIQERAKDSKERILLVALELFANNGYNKTSTREIAQKSLVNISAIKYYFGNKETLYKTVYNQFVKPNLDLLQTTKTPDILEKYLEIMFSIMINEFKRKNSKLGRKLHMREQLDPMGLWKDDIENEIKPNHYYICELIKKEIPKISDSDANRLLFSIVSLFLGIFVNQDVIQAIDNKLISEEHYLFIWKKKLLSYAKAMIELEKNNYKEQE